MALPASLAELISTNPKPRERPVSRSVTTVADSHVPTCENSDSSSALVVEKDRFPTKIFLPMALSCPFPGRLWFGRSCLSEKPRSPRERRAHHAQTRGRDCLCALYRRRATPGLAARRPLPVRG